MFATFNCQGPLNKSKQMNIADNICHHQLTAVMIQETQMQWHRIDKIESSSGEKIHILWSQRQRRI